MKIKLFFYCLLFFNINLLGSLEKPTYLEDLVGKETLLIDQLRKETDPNKQASLKKQIKDIESRIINESEKKKAAVSSNPNLSQAEELANFRKTLKEKQLAAKASTAAKAATAATAQRTIASENLTTTRLFGPRTGSFDQKLQQARDTKVELQQKSDQKLQQARDTKVELQQKSNQKLQQARDIDVQLQVLKKAFMQNELLARAAGGKLLTRVQSSFKPTLRTAPVRTAPARL
jgi:hypothetical protein